MHTCERFHFELYTTLHNMHVPHPPAPMHSCAHLGACTAMSRVVWCAGSIVALVIGLQWLHDTILENKAVTTAATEVLSGCVQLITAYSLTVAVHTSPQ